MGTYSDNENLDLYDEDVEDEDTLEELDVDENGHVIEGRRKRRSRDDEYEPDFGEQESEPERYDEDYEGHPEDSYD